MGYTEMEWRQITNIAIAFFGLGATTLLIIAAWKNRFDPVLTDLVVKNFAAIIGLPFAFMASFIVIAMFKQSTDAIEFKGFGLEFKGASGEIVLWILCFMSIAASIKMLWKS